MAKLVAQLPRRVSHQYRQHYDADIAHVRPQLCPVAERDWVPAWQPTAIYSHSGVVELDCVFTTVSEQGEAIWLVSCYEPNAAHLIMYKITPGMTVAKIEIQLHAMTPGCAADIAYTHTSLSAAGDQFITQFNAAYYQHFMCEWQQHLQLYLQQQLSKNE